MLAKDKELHGQHYDLSTTYRLKNDFKLPGNYDPSKKQSIERTLNAHIKEELTRQVALITRYKRSGFLVDFPDYLVFSLPSDIQSRFLPSEDLPIDLEDEFATAMKPFIAAIARTNGVKDRFIHEATLYAFAQLVIFIARNEDRSFVERAFEVFHTSETAREPTALAAISFFERISKEFLDSLSDQLGVNDFEILRASLIQFLELLPPMLTSRNINNDKLEFYLNLTDFK